MTDTLPEHTPPRARRPGGRPSSTPRPTAMWTLSKVLVVVSLLAIVVAGVRFFRPIENPGVQDCGGPVPYLLSDTEELRPDDVGLLEDVEGCRDLAYDEFEQGMLALGVGIALGLVGAILGLADDRYLLHRAPRFESLLRRRPADAPVALSTGTTSKAISEGRSLPVLDPVDVLYLPLGLVVTFIALRAIAGGEPLIEAYESASFGYALPALLAAVVLPVVAAVQVMSAHPGLSLGRSVEISIASSFRAEASPSLGPFGLAAFLLARRAPRREVVAQLGGVTVASGASHAALLLVGLAVAGVVSTFLQLPDRWWALLLVAVASVMIGFFRGLTPGGRLVARPDVDALRALGATVSGDPGRGALLVGASLLLPVVSGLALWWSAGWAGITLSPLEVLGVVLVVQVAGALGPMPGGVGLIEAVAVWGLVGLGAALAPAVLAVLAYRMLTYWLPMVLGAVIGTKTVRTALGRSADD